MDKLIIDDNISIYYNNCDLDYIINISDYFKNNYKSVMKFFNISKLDKNLNITFYDNSFDFINELYSYTGLKPPFWVTSSSRNNKNDSFSRIDSLSLDNIKNIDYHKNDSIDDLNKCIIHEFVHVCHSQSCDYNYPKELLLVEGVAEYLAKQDENCKMSSSITDILSNEYVDYSNYRYVFNLLVDNYSHDELLDILNNNSKFDSNVIINLLNKKEQ